MADAYHSPVFAYVPAVGGGGGSNSGSFGSSSGGTSSSAGRGTSGTPRKDRRGGGVRIHTAVVFGREGNTPVLSAWQFALSDQPSAAAEKTRSVLPVFGPSRGRDPSHGGTRY